MALAALSTGCYRVDDVRTAEERPSQRARQRVEVSQLDGPHPASVWNSDAHEELGLILQRYLGIPYKGNSRYQAGIDCSRFTAEVYQEFDGRSLPRIAREQARLGAAVSRSGLKYGDLVFFKIGGGSVSHVGIFVGDGRFIHASESRGVVIDNLTDSYWSKHFHSARRLIVDSKTRASR